MATSLNNLALVYLAQDKLTEAEPLFKRTLEIREKAHGPEHPLVAASPENLARLYKAQGKYAEAEAFYKRALEISEKALGPDHRLSASLCENMIELYKKIGKEDEAERLEERARKIRSHHSSFEGNSTYFFNSPAVSKRPAFRSAEPFGSALGHELGPNGASGSKTHVEARSPSMGAPLFQQITLRANGVP